MVIPIDSSLRSSSLFCLGFLDHAHDFPDPDFLALVDGHHDWYFVIVLPLDHVIHSFDRDSVTFLGDFDLSLVSAVIVDLNGFAIAILFRVSSYLVLFLDFKLNCHYFFWS